MNVGDVSASCILNLFVNSILLVVTIHTCEFNTQGTRSHHIEQIIDNLMTYIGGPEPRGGPKRNARSKPR